MMRHRRRNVGSLPAPARASTRRAAALALALSSALLIGGCPAVFPDGSYVSPTALLSEPHDAAVVEEDPDLDEAVIAIAEEEQITRIEMEDGEAEFYWTDTSPEDPQRILPVVITEPTTDLLVKFDSGLAWMEGEEGAPFDARPFIYTGPLDPFDADLFTAGDFDGDSDTDVAIAATITTGPLPRPTTLRVFLNNGAGVFAPGQTLDLPGMGEAHSVSAADVNADARADLLVVGSDASRVLAAQPSGSFLFLDTSTGAASAGAPPPLPGAHVGVLKGFNADSAADILLAPSTGGVSVRLNTGAGAFAPPAALPGIFAFHIVVDDFDADGSRDVAVAGHDPGVVSVYPGTPAGGILAPTNLDATNTPIRLGVIHLTDDDRPDLYTVDTRNNAIQTYFNTPEGWQVADRTTFINQTGRNLGVRPALFVDIDADGYQDLVAGDVSGHLSFSLNAGDGSGALLPPRSEDIGFTINHIRSVGALGAQSEDRPAVVVTMNDFTISTIAYLDTSASPPVWVTPLFIFLPTAPTDVAAADVNGDSLADLVYAHGAGSVTILTQDSVGGFDFADPQTFPTPGGAWSAIAVLDLDGANAPDLVLADGASGAIGLFLSAAGGGFTPGPTYVAPAPLSSNIALGDIDGAGGADVIVGAGATGGVGGEAGSVRVFSNDGAGALGSPVIVPLARRATHVAAGDVNGDGRDDIVATTQRPLSGADGPMAVVFNSPTGIGEAAPLYHYARGDTLWVGLADLRAPTPLRDDPRGAPHTGSLTAIVFGSVAVFPPEPMTRLEPFQSPAPCPGDANGDGVVNFVDLNIVLTFFGQTGAPGAIPGDLDDDGDCDFVDLNIVLTGFGTTC